MALQQPFFSVVRPNPAPSWYVTNGEVTVGPVFTSLLMRGVDEGMVPEHCRVSANLERWRKLDSVREIASRLRPPPSTRDAAEALRELERPLERTRDRDELLRDVTRLAMLVTRAECGMFHLRDRGARRFCTRAVLGPISHAHLDAALPETDPVIGAALLGKPVIGPPYGPAEDALALRFAASAGGVGSAAMLPIFVGNSLLGTLELARPGHGFRRSDLQRAERLAQSALRRHAS